MQILSPEVPKRTGVYIGLPGGCLTFLDLRNQRTGIQGQRQRFRRRCRLYNHRHTDMEKYAYRMHRCAEAGHGDDRKKPGGTWLVLPDLRRADVPSDLLSCPPFGERHCCPEGSSVPRLRRPDALAAMVCGCIFPKRCPSVQHGLLFPQETYIRASSDSVKRSPIPHHDRTFLFPKRPEELLFLMGKSRL